MQGKCKSPPGGMAVSFGLNIDSPEPWAEPRCVIIVDNPLFVVEGSRLWVDSLHIQIIQALEVAPLTSISFGQLFVSNVIIQGDRNSNGMAANTVAGQHGIYAEGVTCHISMKK